MRAAPACRGERTDGREDAAVDADGAAGQRHGSRPPAVEDIAEGGDIHFEQLGEGDLEEIGLTLLENADEKAGLQLSGNGELLDQFAAAVRRVRAAGQAQT